jgi:pyridoxal phosphate enzyme (YggS family)
MSNFQETISKIKNNLQTVNTRVAEAASRSGRAIESVKIITVTKKKSLEFLLAAYECGVRDFGENYAEEGREKIIALEGHQDIRWHMVGHIQSRKAKIVAENFDLIHSVDSLKIADLLNKACKELEKKLPILFEVNISGEASKSGFPAWQQDQWPKLVETINNVKSFKQLIPNGLMTMSPLFTDPELARNFYQRVLVLREHLISKLPEMNWQELSMGTSNDYQIAIEEGATMVRIGEAIVGPRN